MRLGLPECAKSIYSFTQMFVGAYSMYCVKDLGYRAIWHSAAQFSRNSKLHERKVM